MESEVKYESCCGSEAWTFPLYLIERGPVTRDLHNGHREICVVLRPNVLFLQWSYENKGILILLHPYLYNVTQVEFLTLKNSGWKHVPSTSFSQPVVPFQITFLHVKVYTSRASRIEPKPPGLETSTFTCSAVLTALLWFLISIPLHYMSHYASYQVFQLCCGMFISHFLGTSNVRSGEWL